VFKGAPIDELLEKDRLVINKASLRRWFEQLPFEDRPAFLFDEARQAVLPDGSEAAEMNSMKAIALMAHLLAASAGKYRAGERPNSEAIGQTVNDLAKQFFGEEGRGYASFHKKGGAALKTFSTSSSAARPRSGALRIFAISSNARADSVGDDERVHSFSGRSSRQRPSPPSRPSHGRDGCCGNSGTHT
jgi:hypothetical protein